MTTTTTTPVSSAPCASQLLAVLHTNMFPFLSTRDTVVLLSCCSAFWYDTSLAELALRTGAAWQYAQHFGSACELDWFHLGAARLSRGLGEILPPCTHSQCVAGQQPSSHAISNDTLSPQSARPGLHACAQLVSLVDAFERFVLPARLPENHCVTSSGDHVFTVPVAISLWDHHPHKSRLQAGHKWTRLDVKLALNCARKGLGNEFLRRYKTTSDFAIHWTSIAAVDPNAYKNRVDNDDSDTNENIDISVGSRDCLADTALSCIFCDKYAYFDQSYQFGSDEAFQALRASPVGQKFAYCNDTIEECLDYDLEPYDYYAYNVFLNSDDVALLPPSMGRTISEEEQLFDVAEEENGYPTVCRSFAQPLKSFLLTHCSLTNRIEFPISGMGIGAGVTTNIELVAGITQSGYLCGAFFVLTESP